MFIFDSIVCALKSISSIFLWQWKSIVLLLRYWQHRSDWISAKTESSNLRAGEKRQNVLHLAWISAIVKPSRSSRIYSGPVGRPGFLVSALIPRIFRCIWVCALILQVWDRLMLYGNICSDRSTTTWQILTHYLVFDGCMCKLLPMLLLFIYLFIKFFIVIP